LIKIAESVGVENLKIKKRIIIFGNKSTDNILGKEKIEKSFSASAVEMEGAVAARFYCIYKIIFFNLEVYF